MDDQIKRSEPAAGLTSNQDRSGAGDPTESFVYELCRRSYLADYVVPSPRFNKAGAGEKEAADLLIPFERGVLVLQVKSRIMAAGVDPLDETELSRIEKRIRVAVKQVRTFIEARDGRHLDQVETLSGVKRPLSVECLESPLGVAVVGVKTEEGESVDQYDLRHGLATSGGIDVHVFMRADFEVVVAELDTIPDLVEYLQMRGQLIESGALVSGWSEQALLAAFVTQYDKLEAALAGEDVAVVLLDATFEESRNACAEQFARRDASRRQSRFFDGLIAQCREAVGFDTGMRSTLADRESTPGTEGEYARIADALSTFVRAERVAFTAKALEKATNADRRDVPFSYFAQTSSRSGWTVVFVASSKDREDRSRVLEQVCTAAYLQSHVERLVGIAAPNLSAKSGSLDFLLMDAGLEFEDEGALRDVARKAFGPPASAGQDEWSLQGE